MTDVDPDDWGSAMFKHVVTVFAAATLAGAVFAETDPPAGVESVFPPELKATQIVWTEPAWSPVPYARLFYEATACFDPERLFSKTPPAVAREGSGSYFAFDLWPPHQPYTPKPGPAVVPYWFAHHPPPPPRPRVPIAERFPAAPDWAADRVSGTYDPDTGEFWITAHQPVALVGLVADGDVILPGSFGDFGGLAAVDTPHLREIAWVAAADILGGPGSTPGSNTVGGAMVAPGTPASDLVLLFQLVGHELWRGTFTLVGDGASGLATVPEPATAALLTLAAVALRRRRR